MKPWHRPRVAAVTAVSSFILPLSSLGQGALAPPGAPSPTMKTLEQIEPRTPITNLPYTISAPGSYYVVTNLTGTAGQEGLTITAANVTVDLGGFTLSGPGQDGIVLAATATNVAIRNGTVKGWNQSGVNAHEFSPVGTRLENLRAVQNAQAGLAVGHRGVVQNCYAEGNGSWGILARRESRVIACTANGNGSIGIAVEANAVIKDCLVTNSGGVGIDTQGGNVIHNCQVSDSGGNGIDTFASTITDCVVSSNDGHGIVASSSQIRGCTAYINTGDGIRVSSGCSLMLNTCEQNGFSSGVGAGIHATSGRNRIDSNNVTYNDRGLDVDAGSNVIIRNSAGGNSVANYDIVGGNDIGPIGTAAASTSPWANISY